jgi:3-keto-5-aminohexanoate cleavage enzyme
MFLTAAIVGAEATHAQNPAVPYLPSEIADEAIRCWEKGASMVHLHARKPDGTPSQSAELFGEAIERIRAACDIIVQVSTGGAVGMTGEERCQPLTLSGALAPEMATLSCGSVNFGEEIFENPRPLMRDIAGRIRAAGIKPELEIFDTGMMDEARYLQKKGLIDFPAHFDFVLGVPGGLAAREDALDYLLTLLPEGSTWSVAGIGRFELPMVEAAAKRGGHARVGFEDNVFLSKGVLAKGSFELVEAATAIAKRCGRRIATPAETRQILGIEGSVASQ